jgi:hypothetical protein
MDPKTTARMLERIRDLAGGVERPSELGELEITITPPPGAFDEDLIRRYADLGVHRIVPIGLGGDAATLVAHVHKIAEAVARSERGHG